MQQQLDDLDSETYRCDQCGHPCDFTVRHMPVSSENLIVIYKPKDCPAHSGITSNWQMISKVRQERKA